jgi:hypothetical protein
LAEKLKIGLILNSHRDESLNYALMHSYWFENYGCNVSLEVLYIGNKINFSTVLPILETLKGFGDLNIKHYPVYEVKFSKSKRLYLLFQGLYRSTFILFNCRTIFVAYDLPEFLLTYFHLVKWKNIFALPHTLGLESYAQGIFKTTRKPFHSIPVIAKIPCSVEYFNYLGFKNIVFAGIYYYNRQDDYFSGLMNCESKQNYDAVIYALHSKSDQYTLNSWIETFYGVFNALKNADLDFIGITLHPSQPTSDFQLLKELASKFNLNIFRITGFALTTLQQSGCFINVMTSAGQIPFAAGKKVCNYGSNKLRKDILKFGNDPYPYAQFTVEEIETPTNLTTWLISDSASITVNHNDFQPVSYNELIKLQ